MTAPLYKRALQDCESYLESRRKDGDYWTLNDTGNLTPSEMASMTSTAASWLYQAKSLISPEPLDERLKFINELRVLANTIKTKYQQNAPIEEIRRLEIQLRDMYCNPDIINTSGRLHDIMIRTQRAMLLREVSYHVTENPQATPLAQRAIKDMDDYHFGVIEREKTSFKKMPCVSAVLPFFDKDQSENRAEISTNIRKLSNAISDRRDQETYSHVLDRADILERAALLPLYVNDNISKTAVQSSLLQKTMNATKIAIIQGDVTCAELPPEKAGTPACKKYKDVFVATILQLYQEAHFQLQSPDAASIFSTITNVSQGLATATDRPEIKVINSIAGPILEYFKTRNAQKTKAIADIVPGNNIAVVEEIAQAVALKFLENRQATIDHLGTGISEYLAKRIAVSGIKHLCESRKTYEGTVPSLLQCIDALYEDSMSFTTRMVEPSKPEKKEGQVALQSAILYKCSKNGKESFYLPRNTKYNSLPEIEHWTQDIDETFYEPMSPEQLKEYWARKILSEAKIEATRNFKNQPQTAKAKDTSSKGVKFLNPIPYTLRDEASKTINDISLEPLMEALDSSKSLGMSTETQERRKQLANFTAEFISNVLVRPSSNNPNELKLQAPKTSGQLTLFKSSDPTAKWIKESSEKYATEIANFCGKPQHVAKNSTQLKFR